MTVLNRPSDPLQTSVQFVKGVGPYVGGLLKKKDISTVVDLLYHFPLRYLDRRKVSSIQNLSAGEGRTIIAEVLGGESRFLPRSRKKIYELVVKDTTGLALITWFHFKEDYLKKKYKPGDQLLITGPCQIYQGKKQFVHPEIEDWEDDDKHLILPIYPLTEGLYQNTLRRIIGYALENYLDDLEESPLTVRSEGAKFSLKEAISKIHFPPDDSKTEDLDHMRTPWHQRVIYDELFYLQLGMGLKKKGYQKAIAIPFVRESLFEKGMKLLPFELTKAQKKVLREIRGDLQKDKPMNRLLQGDVGCGKTLVAFLSALPAIEEGYQVALMAPTEILASQHDQNLGSLCRDLQIPMGLLTGSTPKQNRDQILDQLKSGKLRLIIGTHALIQESVEFDRLGYIIIDEQHRFGVLQRAQLKQKSNTPPHILVMTATPIPRTMAMSVYGDLDISVIDELPKGRRPIQTTVYREKLRPKAYELIQRELDAGHQVYFVCPLIEESEKVDLKNAESTAESLQLIFKTYSVGLLHGRLPAEEKESIMQAFKQNKIHLLVSTTVIEVGVDVPNASVMAVEHAERFGLSQLHQLRGRVGRGGNKSFCLLFASYAQSEESRYRLKVMEETTDGFVIAEEDLKIRGPGDFLGTRQAGLPTFHLAHFARDGILLGMARKRAFEIIECDPDLKMDEHQLLKKILAQRWEGKLDLAQIS